jgi:hypothetical protein
MLKNELLAVAFNVLLVSAWISAKNKIFNFKSQSMAPEPSPQGF